MSSTLLMQYQSSLLAYRRATEALVKAGIEPEEIEPIKTTLKWMEVYKFVSEHFDLELKSKSRKRKFIIARAAACYLLRKYTTLSLEEVGELLNRDHSTVSNSIEKVRHWKYTKDAAWDEIAELEENLLKVKNQTP